MHHLLLSGRLLFNKASYVLKDRLAIVRVAAVLKDLFIGLGLDRVPTPLDLIVLSSRLFEHFRLFGAKKLLAALKNSPHRALLRPK